MADPNPKGSLLLGYHRIGSPLVKSVVRGQYVLPGLFQKQIDLLECLGYRPIALPKLLSQTDEKGLYCITFDDGYKSVGDLAYPILADRGIPATIFVVAGAVGKTNAWDVEIGDRVEKMLSASELIEMSENGIEIGAHTMSHAHLPQLNDAELHKEILDSKKVLEDMLGKTVAGFCYPYGEWDARVRDVVIEAGFEYAVSTNRGTINSHADKFALPRINVRWNNGGWLLKRKIEDAYCRQNRRDSSLFTE